MTNSIVAERKYHDDLVKLYFCFIFSLFARINTIHRQWINMYNECGHIYMYADIYAVLRNNNKLSDVHILSQ